MPNTKSAAKRMRSSAKKRFRNQSVFSELHTLYRKLAQDVASKSETVKEEARELVSKLDKAVSYGVIPHRRADRKKSRIARLLQSLRTPSKK